MIGRLFLWSLVLALICFAAFQILLPDLARGEEPSFDARLAGYSLEQTRHYLDWLEHRDLITPYLTVFRWIDWVFPLSIFGMLVSAIWGLWGRPAPAIAVLSTLVAIGFLVADYVENAAVAVLLSEGAAQVTQRAVDIASSATQGKWIFLGASVAIVLLGLIVTLFRQLRG